MFKITPIQDKEIQKKFALECDMEYCEDLFGYSMIDQESGELMGMSQFDISGASGYISAIKPRIGYADFEAMFILGRATMNFIDLCGAHTCYANKEGADMRLLKSIGFKELEGGELFADMTGMFEGHCDGHGAKFNTYNIKKIR